jgi:Ca2+-binding EF-hand superfamily protein
VGTRKLKGEVTESRKAMLAGVYSFDNGKGKIDSKKLRKSLLSWGRDSSEESDQKSNEKRNQRFKRQSFGGFMFTREEVDDAFDQMVIDDKGFIDTAALITMLTGSEEEEE